MTLRWLDRGEYRQYCPCLLVGIGERYLYIRFGKEEFIGFTERLQGIIPGVPIQWHYYLGKRLSLRYLDTRPETLTEYLVSEADKHIGEYIEFLFYPGWGGPVMVMSGYLHDTTTYAEDPRYPKRYMHIDDRKRLPKGKNAAKLGGYSLYDTDTFKVVRPR